MAQIDYYFSTVSPYAYLAGTRLEQIAARHGAEITYRPVNLNQMFDRTGGIRRSERHPSRLEYRAQELPRWAEYLQMPFNLTPQFDGANAAPSSYAIIAAADARGRGADGDLGQLVHSILRAHWAEDRSIAEDSTLRDLLQGAGFDPSLVDSGLFIGAETFGRNLEAAVADGVFGSPFYIVRESGQKFWGQDRLDFLDRHLASL